MAGVHCPLDLHVGVQLAVRAVATLGPVLLDEHQHVVDVDLDLLDELDLEDDVVVDRLLVGVLLPPERLVEVEVEAAVVLELALGEDLVAREVVEAHQDVVQPQDDAEQRDERLLVLLALNRLADRVNLQELRNMPLVRAVVLGVRLQQHDPRGVLVAEQRERVVGLLLQVAERDDVAVRLDRVQDPVCPGEGLQQPVLAQALVDPKRVERGRIETGQEHVDHDGQVDLTVPESQRQVAVVVLKPVGRSVEAGAEHRVVVADRCLEKVAR